MYDLKTSLINDSPDCGKLRNGSHELIYEYIRRPNSSNLVRPPWDGRAVEVGSQVGGGVSAYGKERRFPEVGPRKNWLRSSSKYEVVQPFGSFLSVIHMDDSVMYPLSVLRAREDRKGFKKAMIRQSVLVYRHVRGLKKSRRSPPPDILCPTKYKVPPLQDRHNLVLSSPLGKGKWVVCGVMELPLMYSEVEAHTILQSCSSTARQIGQSWCCVMRCHSMPRAEAFMVDR